MEILISLKDVGVFIIFAVIVTVGVLITIVLFRVKSLLKKVNNVIDDNKANLDRTLDILPNTLTSVNLVAIEVKNTVDKASGILHSFNGTVSDAATSVEETTEYFILIVKSIVSTIMAVKDLFSSK